MAEASRPSRQRQANPRYRDAGHLDWLDSGDEENYSDSESSEGGLESESSDSESDSESHSQSEADSEHDDDDAMGDAGGDGTGNAAAFTESRPLLVKDFPWNPNTGGVNVRIAHGATYFDYLKLFFTTAVMQVIVTETNRYGASKYGDHWDDMTETDIWRLFAVILLMGIIRKPHIQSYWSTKKYFATPAIANIISRDRFLKQLSALHFADNDTQPQAGTNKLFKLGQILKLLQQRFAAVMHPGKFLSLDESLVPWKGRLSFRQYIPSKRSRFGIKLFAVCDGISGYVSRISVYIGDEKEKATAAGLPVVINIVMTLMSGLLRLGHMLFMDNFYNSPELATRLVEETTHVCGTLRMNRKGVPKNLQKKDNGRPLEKGDIKFFTNSNCLVGSWRDKKFVNIITTMHENFGLIDSGKTKRDGTVIMKPRPIIDYNKYMGGVDRVDQVLHYYTCVRKTMKWYRKLFFHLLDVSTVLSVTFNHFYLIFIQF